MRLRLLVLLVVLISFIQCNHRYKVTYDIPANYPEARRQEIIEIFSKGKELFKINCSECHGIFTAAREKVPDFSTTQLDNYSTRYLNGDMKNHSVAAKMSPEQLSQVMMFLRFKKNHVKDTTSRRKK